MHSFASQGTARERDSDQIPLRALSRISTANTLVWTSGSQNSGRKSMSVVLSHPVCGTLLRQPQETNRPSL